MSDAFEKENLQTQPYESRHVPQTKITLFA